MSTLKDFSKILGRDVNKFIRLSSTNSCGKPVFVYGPSAKQLEAIS